MKKIFIPFLFSICFITTFLFIQSCEAPLSFLRTDNVTVNFEDWPSSPNYPSLLYWKITVIENGKSTTFTKSQTDTSINLTLPKDNLAVIKVQPVIDNSDAPEFFCNGGLLYPFDFKDNQGYARWCNYAVCEAASKILLKDDSYEKRISIRYFNWKKLEETLWQKDIVTFSKYDTLATKKCTTSFNTDIETLTDRIINPPSRFTVPYFETSSILPSKIKNLMVKENNVILHSYIPLNDLYKEKGCITVQVKPDNYKTAFLANGQLIYIRNKELVLD